MIKSILVKEDVHADLLLLKRIKGTASLSDLIRLLMELSKFTEEFFERMEHVLEGSA